MNDKQAAIGNFAIAGVFAAISLWLIIGSKHETPQRNEYKNGEILYPDMVHDDTLTVINADGLNQAATYWDGSDSDINEALHLFCK